MIRRCRTTDRAFQRQLLRRFKFFLTGFISHVTVVDFHNWLRGLLLVDVHRGRDVWFSRVASSSIAQLGLFVVNEGKAVFIDACELPLLHRALRLDQRRIACVRLVAR